MFFFLSNPTFCYASSSRAAPQEVRRFTSANEPVNEFALYGAHFCSAYRCRGRPPRASQPDTTQPYPLAHFPGVYVYVYVYSLLCALAVYDSPLLCTKKTTVPPHTRKRTSSIRLHCPARTHTRRDVRLPFISKFNYAPCTDRSLPSWQQPAARHYLRTQKQAESEIK